MWLMYERPDMIDISFPLLWVVWAREALLAHVMPCIRSDSLLSSPSTGASEFILILTEFIRICSWVYFHRFYPMRVCVCVKAVWISGGAVGVFPWCWWAPPPNPPPQVQEDFNTSSWKLLCNYSGTQGCRFKPSQYVDKVCTYVHLNTTGLMPKALYGFEACPLAYCDVTGKFQRNSGFWL